MGKEREIIKTGLESKIFEKGEGTSIYHMSLTATCVQEGRNYKSGDAEKNDQNEKMGMGSK